MDANVLLYAVNENAPAHEVAKAWLEETLAGSEAVGFAWIVLLAFARIATLPAAFPAPLAVADALDLLDDWLSAPAATQVHPTARHASLLRGLLGDAGTAGNLVADAHLAALALEHGAAVCSFDRDFARFRGLRVFAPS